MSTDCLTKALKVLRITSTSKLLSLPRELRDEIWRQVVQEPFLIFRQHQRDCSFHDALASYETPPAILVRYWELYGSENDGRKHLNGSKPPEQLCKEECLRRRSMGLLRVNKLVSQEAIEMLYRVNTFCFLSSRDTIKAVDEMPQIMRARIRKLAILQIDEGVSRVLFPWNERQPSFHDLRDKFFKSLRRLPRLKELELPTHYLKYQDLEDRLGQAEIETIRLSFLREIIYTNNHENRHEFAYLARTFSMPKCQRNACAKKPKRTDLEGFMLELHDIIRQSSVPLKHLLWCRSCRLQKSAIDEFAKQGMFEYERPEHGVMDQVAVEVIRRRISHGVDGLYSFKMTLQDAKKQVVVVLGSPRESSHARRKRQIREKIAENSRRRDSTSGSSTVCHAQRKLTIGTDGELHDTLQHEPGEFFPYNRRSHRRPQLEEQVDHREILKERQERRDTAARQFLTAKKNAQERAVRQGQRELEEQKSAARSRVGKCQR